MGKTPPKKEEADGSPKNKAARVDNAAWITASAPSSTGKTPPKGDEAAESPRNKALRLFGANLPTAPGASEPSPTGKTPPKADEAGESPRKKTLRRFDVSLPTAPGASEPNPTGTTPPKGDDAEGSSPKRSRSPRQQDKRPAAAVPLATVPESSELTVKGVGRPSDEESCKCNHVITDTAIDELRAIEEDARVLTSKDALVCYGCSNEDKEGKVRFRPEKSDLLICVKCNNHFCCGFGSIELPFGHSREHADEKEHCFAVLLSDPPKGYCFKCDAEVPMAVKSVSRKLLAPQPLVGQTEAEKVEMTSKVQAESHPSGIRSSDAQGYAIRGMKNLRNTCYMSAVLQCLFALGKLRERMLADHPKGLPKVLKELLVEASAAGDVLNPTEVLKCVSRRAPGFQVGSMEDSHEFLTVLLDLWMEHENIYARQSNAPTAIDSIFRFEMLQSLACKKCDYPAPAPALHSFLDLTLNFPPKWHQRNLEKMQTVSESGYSRVIGSEVIVEKTHKPLEVDSTQAQRISQSKDVVQSLLQIKESKSVDSLTEDSISIERLLLLFSEAEEVKWSCPTCAKDHKEPSANQSKNCEQIVGSSNEDDVGLKTFHFLTLPPVLTLHLNRTSRLEGTSMVENMDGDNTVGSKINGHVRFGEYLDVKPLITSSANNFSTQYRLAGVVEHIGKGS